MTKFQKQMLTIAAAGALTAVTALPAMALENEFHGLYNFNAIFANYNGAILPGTAQNNKADQTLEQRVRLQYIAKASSDLKLVTHFEINNIYGGTTTGSDIYGQTFNSNLGFDASGSDLDTDGVNLMTKHAYLDFNVAKDVNVTLGLQAYKDAIGGIFVDADMPAVFVTTKMAGVDAKLGMSRYKDNKYQTLPTTSTSTTGTDPSTDIAGDATTDLYMLDTAYNLNKSTKVGVSVYGMNDTTATAHRTVYTYALTGATSFNGVNVKGFVAMQDGKAAVSKVHYEGKAFNLVADTKIAGGTLKAGYLYVTGEDSGSDTSRFQTTGVTTYNDSGMMLLIRNTAHNVTATGSFYGGADSKFADINNVRLLHVGYSTSLTDKLAMQANLGVRWNNEAATGTSGTTNIANQYKGYMGTEVNGEVSYKLYPNMSVLAQAGYVSLASDYVGEDPYTVRAGVRFSF